MLHAPALLEIGQGSARRRCDPESFSGLGERPGGRLVARVSGVYVPRVAGVVGVLGFAALKSPVAGGYGGAVPFGYGPDLVVQPPGPHVGEAAGGRIVEGEDRDPRRGIGGPVEGA